MTSSLEQVRERMSVVDIEGNTVGTVDRVEDGRIKLTRSDSTGAGETGHRYVSLNAVESIRGDTVRLNGNAVISHNVPSPHEAEALRPTEKMARPSTHFEEPRDVVTDDQLTDDQKRKALETLEQDARQLSDADAEGMSGGERSNLDDVLDAKNDLASPGRHPAQPDTGALRLKRTIQEHPVLSMALAVVAGIGLGIAARR